MQEENAYSDNEFFDFDNGVNADDFLSEFEEDRPLYEFEEGI